MAEQSVSAADAARQAANRKIRSVSQDAVYRPAAAGRGTVGQVADILAGRDVATPEPEAPEPEEQRPPSPPEPQADDQVEGDELEGEGELEQADEGPATIDDVARKLGLSKAELNAVEVAVGHERMTLGELKAKLPELAKLDKSRADLDDAKGEWELQRIDSLRRITAIVERFPPQSIPPGVLQAIEADHQHSRAREATLLTTARKEWSDPVYAATERQNMAKIAARYGFTAGDVGSIMDHRQVLLLQDFAALQSRFDKLKAEPRRELGTEKGPARADGAASQSKRAPSTRTDMAARVGALLRR